MREESLKTHRAQATERLHACVVSLQTCTHAPSEALVAALTAAERTIVALRHEVAKRDQTIEV